MAVAGHRAAVAGDRVESLVEGPGVLHVLNAPSPAATASLVIGQTIAERVEERF